MSENTRRLKCAVVAATIGDGFQTTLSSSRSMVAVGAGIIHRF